MAALSDYVDGDLPAALRRQVEAHVAVCRECERFGASFARLLDAVRRQLAAPDPVPADVLGRLNEALARRVRS